MTLGIYAADRADRTEVIGLLARLSPSGRVEFLNWCCRRTSGKLAVAFRDEPPLRDEIEAWIHLTNLCTSYGVDWDAARAELERRVRLGE